MTKLAEKTLRHFTMCLALTVGCIPMARAGTYQHGTVVRMRMGECLPSHHGFMQAFGQPQSQMGEEVCPEYTLVSDKVVYVIVGRSANQLVPLADVIDFRLHNNEMAVRLDDAKRESKFAIKEMVLRSEWDMVQRHIADQLSNPSHEDSAAMRRPN
jgi:hypothetical protein